MRCRARVGLCLKCLNPPYLPLWCGAKISPHPRPITFTRRRKPTWGKAGRAGSSGTGQNCHPYAYDIPPIFIYLNSAMDSTIFSTSSLQTDVLLSINRQLKYLFIMRWLKPTNHIHCHISL